MSKKVDNEVLETVEEVSVEVEELDPDTVYAYLVRKEDGYHIIDFDGTEGPVCKVTEDNYIALTKNKANRQWFSGAKAEKLIADGVTEIPLTYKASRKFGSNSGTTRIPNEKLISYLPEAEQAEYKAIIARAIEAKNADKKKPMTEIEKAQAKIEKAKAALAKLLEEAEEMGITPEV